MLIVGLLLPPLANAATPLNLSTTGVEGPMGPALEYLIERGEPLSLASAQKADFQPYSGAVFNLGLEPAPIWIRLPVVNTESEPRQWVLALNRALLEELDIYLVIEQHTRDVLRLSRLSAKDLYEEFGTLAARFELEGSASGTIYLRYRAPNSSSLPLTIRSESEFQETRFLNLAIYLACLVGVTTLVLYNLIMFFITGLKPFPYYVISQVLTFAYFSHLGGISSIFLWPDQPEIGRALAAPLTSGISIFMCFFARSFLDTSATAPRVDRLLVTLIALHTIVAVIAVFQLAFGIEERRLLNLASSAFTGITWIALPVIGIRYSLSGELRFLPVTLAWIIFALGAIYTMLSLLGQAPVITNFLTAYSLLNYTEALLLAISLALWVRDIRARSLATEIELSRQLQLKLEESERSRHLAEERSLAIQELGEQGRLLQAAGHDSRQMLGAMRHFASGLRGATNSEEVETASRSIVQLTDHLDDVLTTTVGTYQGGGLNANIIALERVHVADLLEPLRMIYQRMAAANDVWLRYRSVNLNLITDRVLLLRIISNLLGNAIKYSAGGRVLVAGRLRKGCPVIEIWDAGPGMDPMLLQDLLEEGARARRDSELPGNGTGIRIARKLTAALGGELVAETRPGSGTRFQIRLPGVQSDQVGKDSRSVSVAIFDQESMSLSGLARELSQISTRFQAVCYKSIDEWEKRAAKPEPDVALVDYDFDGRGAVFARELTRTPSKSGEQPGMVVTLMTHDRGADVRNTAAKSASVLLYKPVEIEVLRALLARFVH